MLNTMLRDSTFDRLAREMDRLVRAPRGGAGPGGGRATPAVNIWREGESLIVEAEVPGFRMSDIELLVSEDQLTLRGQRSAAQAEDAKAMRRERSLTRFERSFRFPLPLDADSAQATLTHGVLRITLPIAEAARPRRIEVKSQALADGQDGGAEPVIEEVN